MDTPAKPSGRRWFIYLAGLLAVELSLAALIPLGASDPPAATAAGKSASAQAGPQAYLPLVTSAVRASAIA